MQPIISLFENLSKELMEIGSQVSTSELHGLHVGMFCSHSDLGSKQGQDLLIKSLGCREVNHKIKEFLVQLYQITLHSFESINFEFQLLLPGDDIELCKRSKSLSDWCRGFLSGLGLAGVTQDMLCSKLVKEAISDISEIAHAQVSEYSAEEEEAYLELVEYVWVAVQTIQIELRVAYEQEKTSNLH